MTAQERPRGDDFTLLVHSFAYQASAALGLASLPGAEGPPKVDLPLAQHLIDILAMLQAKTAGNLTPEEEAALTDILAHLRMAYVEVSSKAAPPPEPAEGQGA